ncbi:MAG: hypothetical protein AAFV29_14980 [Myxococcota bacterium]
MTRPLTPVYAVSVNVGTLVVLLTVASTATPPWLSKAESLIEALSFEQAATILRENLSDDAPPSVRLKAYRLLAHAQIATADAAGSTEAYVKVLKLDPQFKLSRRSAPKLRAALARARTRLGDRWPVLKMTRAHANDSLHESAEDLGWALELSLNDPLKMVQRVQVGWRRVGDASFNEMWVDGWAKNSRQRVAIEAGDATRVELYARAFTAAERVATTVAAPNAPQVERMAMVPSNDVRWYERWWVWAAVGVVAAGAATAVVVSTQSPDDGLGTLRLP